MAEHDLLESVPQISQTAEHPRLNEIFNHDTVVKVVNGRDVLLDSYWDDGYVMADVENSAKARYIRDIGDAAARLQGAQGGESASTWSVIVPM